MPTPDEQDALTAGEEEVVAAKPADVAVPAVNVDVLLAVDTNDDWELDGTAGLDVIEHVGVKRKLCELLEKCRATRQKIQASVAKPFGLISKQPGSVEAY